MSSTALSTAVLIPALNCAETVAGVVRGARRLLETVVVVDDGSADETGNRAAEAGAQIVRHRANLGKGAALRTGLQLLAERGFDRVVTMDGDGQHLSDQIPTLLRISDEDPRALVIGARQVEPGLVSPMRDFGNRFANRWVRIACGQELPDTQAGFRVYPVRATLALGTRAQHFGFETEVLIRAARAGLPIRSVVVKTFYPPVQERRSHYRPVWDTVRIIFIVLGLIFRIW